MKPASLGMKKSGNANSIGTYVILVLTLGAMTFFGVCSPQQGNQGGISGAAGKVDGETITNGDFARAYERQSQQMRSQYGENFDPHALKVADRVLDQLINQRILYLKAQELGLGASEEEIIKSLNAQINFNDKDGKFSDENFKRFLRANQMTELSLQDELRRMLVMQKLQQLLTSSVFVSSKEATLDWRTQESKLNLDYIKIDPSSMPVVVTDEERAAFRKEEKVAHDKIKAWYDSHSQDYKKPEEVHARHILKSYAGARNADTMGAKRTKDEARKEAERVLAKLKAKGANFVKIAKLETDELQGKSSGGDLGFFRRDGMVKEFSDVAFALAPGKISPIVESPFGFHIIEVVAKDLAKEESLEQAAPHIVDLLISKEKAPAQAETLAAEVLAHAKDKKASDDFLQKHRLRWERTGEFALSARYIPVIGAKPDIIEQVFAMVGGGGEAVTLVKALPTYYVVKVGEFKAADAAKIDKDQIAGLRSNAAFAQGYGFFADFEGKARKEYDQKKAIYKNPEYLALDNAKTNQDNGTENQ